MPAVRDKTGRIVVPATSAGFEHIDFARDTLRHPLDPWQEWAAIHAGELLPDGRPRFRIVLILVARQNGKTELLVVLCLHWQFVDGFPLILGTSTKLDYAKESWKKSLKLAKRVSDFEELRGPYKWWRDSNGEQESWTTEDSRYKIAASNEEGGRSLTINRLVCDELRQHHDYSAWSAAEEATSAIWDAQIWALSNAGDTRSVVLNDHREQALAMIEFITEHGEVGYGELLAAGHDPRLGLFEWSAPPEADPRDIHALAMANPNLNRRKDGEVLMTKARRAVELGGDALAAFKTESMCIQVPKLDPALDGAAWERCKQIGDLSAVRSRVALCLDVSPDGLHATLAAAAVLPDGRVRVEIVAAWGGSDALRLRDEASGVRARVRQVRPRAFGWLPNGPAAAYAADLADRRKDGRPWPGWPPPGVKVEEIRGEVAAVCMGFAAEVAARQIVHSDDPLLNDHVLPAEKLRRPGDTWVFSRRGGHCDALYAAAGAVHLARTLPAPPVSSKIY